MARLHPIMDDFRRSDPPKCRRGLQPKRVRFWVQLQGIHPPNQMTIASWDHPPPETDPPELKCQGLQPRHHTP